MFKNLRLYSLKDVNMYERFSYELVSLTVSILPGFTLNGQPPPLLVTPKHPIECGWEFFIIVLKEFNMYDVEFFYEFLLLEVLILIGSCHILLVDRFCNC